MEKRRIIDNRRKEKYMLDDEYLNGQAKLCGWQGTIVYNSLCRHANKNQESFPSIKTMSEQHGVGRKTILKGISNLEKRKVISVKKNRSKSGKWFNNTYILLDKSEWDYDQVPEKDTDSHVPVGTTPCPSGDTIHVPVRDTKETHREGNTYKKTHYSEQSSRKKEIDEIFDIFYRKCNPTINWGNKTSRKAAADLIGRFGLEATKKFALFACSVQGKEFAPTITTPHQLKEKLASLKNYHKRLTDKKPIII